MKTTLFVTVLLVIAQATSLKQKLMGPLSNQERLTPKEFLKAELTAETDADAQYDGRCTERVDSNVCDSMTTCEEIDAMIETQ